jgi:hypothetical protein
VQPEPAPPQLGNATAELRPKGQASRNSWQHRWQHPDPRMRPYRPRNPHDLDASARSGRIYVLPRRLRAWSGITGWRFESSSAHHDSPTIARFLVRVSCGGEAGAHPWQHAGNRCCAPRRRSHAAGRRLDRLPSGAWVRSTTPPIGGTFPPAAQRAREITSTLGRADHRPPAAARAGEPC